MVDIPRLAFVVAPVEPADAGAMLQVHRHPGAHPQFSGVVDPVVERRPAAAAMRLALTRLVDAVGGLDVLVERPLIVLAAGFAGPRATEFVAKVDTGAARLLPRDSTDLEAGEVLREALAEMGAAWRGPVLIVATEPEELGDDLWGGLSDDSVLVELVARESVRGRGTAAVIASTPTGFRPACVATGPLDVAA